VRRRARRGTVLAGLVAVAVWGPTSLAARQLTEFEQSRVLMEAATLESRGDLDGAEAALRRLLESNPGSSGALFGLERVLRAKGELLELRPLVDAYLARNESAEVHGLKLELLVEADSVSVMVADAERWMAADPREPTFQEVARAYERALGRERALEVLRRGRSVLGGGALALETGDLLAASGDFRGAGEEWALAVASGGSGMEAVRVRLARMREGRLDAARRVVAILGESALAERRRATVALALEQGLAPEALELAERHASGLAGRARATFLNETGILAREAGAADVASWAYGRLADQAANPEERREYDRRIVDVAREAGDVAAALAAQRRILASHRPRSDEWRRAFAEAIELEATAEPERALESWTSFRADFPEAPELDAVAAAVAASLQARGDLQRAAAVLEGIEGPRSTIERAYLRLDAGDVEGARALLLSAVGGLPPVEATPVIQLVSLLGRLSGAGARALAEAGARERRAGPGEAALRLAERTRELPEADRAPVLAEAARMAERGGREGTAAEMRRRIVEEHPDAPEAAEAALGFARYVAGRGGDVAEAIQILEDLITRRPNAAVVPEARLELERLRNRGAGAGRRS
jgi:tetratricopeptide (TPR) repeat protein